MKTNKCNGAPEMTEEKILEILKDAGVLMRGHFLLTSGKHSDTYLQCAKIFKNAEYSEALCAQLADKFRDSGAELVIGPAMGAVIMAYEVSRHLKIPNAFTERENGEMTLRRSFFVEPGQKVLVVEDVITTGGSVKEVIQLVREAGGVVIGVGCIVDRTGGISDFGVPLSSVISVEAKAYEPEACPLCEKGELSPVKPGSRSIKGDA